MHYRIFPARERPQERYPWEEVGGHHQIVEVTCPIYIYLVTPQWKELYPLRILRSISRFVTMVMHLTHCCCGCTLKTGSVIIGILGAISSLSTLVACIVFAGGSDKVRQSTSSSFRKSNDFPFGSQDTPNFVDFGTSISTGAEVFFIVYSIISAIQLILNIVLIFGASADKANLVKPWIIAGVISAVATGLTNVVQIIMCFVAELVTVGFILLAVYGVLMCIIVYFILVVNSFHTELTAQHIPKI